MYNSRPCDRNRICSIIKTSGQRTQQISLRRNESIPGETCSLKNRVGADRQGTLEWGGLVNDPDMDRSFKLNKGLRISRALFRDLTHMGVPIASEMSNTISINVYPSDM